MRYICYFFILIFLASCESESLEDLYPQSTVPCKSKEISYSEDIVPILEAKCYRCHDDENAFTFAQGIFLEGYDNVKLILDSDPNLIYSNVARLPGYVPMPGASLPKLDDCSIEKIRVWIEEGYPNN